MEFSIDIPVNKFNDHLSLDENQGIIFSGRFGIGKTYFLKRYFELNKEKYDVVHLFPVNYSISSNKDIFELVKHDILFELIQKSVTFDQLEIKHIDTIIKYAKENGHHILSPFINLIPGLGKSLYTIYEKLQKLSVEYLEQHEKAQIDDEKEALKYLEAFTLKEGCIYEEDFFTQLICQLVDQLKHNPYENAKETVLVIDDLDRIDPEHIFRILNVLAAHTDLKNRSSKFNFDRIILVCDIDNIRKIFQNRYGADVDFTGYIDKFYSQEIFDFNNADGLSEQVLKLLLTIKQPKKPEHFDFSDQNSLVVKNLAYILTAMINANTLTVRNLKRIVSKTYTPSDFTLRLKTSPGINNNHVDAIIIVDCLLWIFSRNLDQLIEAVKPCEEFVTQYFHERTRLRFCEYALAILDYKQHKFKVSETKLSYHRPNTELVFVYNIESMRGWGNKILCNVDRVVLKPNVNDPIQLSELDYFPMLHDMLKMCRDEKILQGRQ